MTRGYHLIRLPYDVILDHKSARIHGITAEDTWSRGRTLRRVLRDFFQTIEQYRPTQLSMCCTPLIWMIVVDGIVGHDVMGDVNLLVSELL